jgi:predicted amidohydrolase
MKVAAYQAPLPLAGARDAVEAIAARVRRCEAAGVRILCCPEAVLGGLADQHPEPARIALPADGLADVLAPLASETVTTLVGFTEHAADGRFFNAAAVLHRGAVTGIYRKLHPALRRSVYAAGAETPVWAADGLTFGIVLCNDSNFAEPARRMAAQGAAALFVPTNNALPPPHVPAGIAAEARAVDAARAAELRMWIVRADVAGRDGERVSHGSSAIVDPTGRVVHAARPLAEDLLIADIDAVRPGDAAPSIR